MTTSALIPALAMIAALGTALLLAWSVGRQFGKGPTDPQGPEGPKDPQTSEKEPKP